jgi:gamma-glutamylcyclotransferase (GGCT)/AIG2-like uncharacterized protein YtfP
MTRYYFAYGMNTNAHGMSQRCPDAVCISPGTIKDQKLAFRYHADIEYSLGDAVSGVVWAITDACEFSLDCLEGYPHYYDKREFVVELPTGQQIVAMAYQMTNQTRYELPADHYRDCLLEGYIEHEVDVDQIYQALEECSVFY